MKKAIFCAVLLFPCLSFYGPGHPSEPKDPMAVLESYPKDYFMPPVTDPLLVTGTFGELRPNHFHSGLDLRSKTGGVGQPVYAAAEGYVDQIKVQGGGYGNVLYLKHPNGYTTVYAHLDRFSPELAAAVKEAQYKRERFEITIDFPKDKFKVKKGEEIAKMGNSGGSTGPHLHFEIRANGRPINPLLFGIVISDKKAPDIRDMKIYHLNEQREVVKSAAFPIEKRIDGLYGLKGGIDQKAIGAWRVGFGIKVYDRTNLLPNDNGIYALSMYVDGKLAYSWTAESFHFDETRYLNALCDYSAQKRYGAWFHRTFVLPGDRLSMYETTETMGAIPLSATQPVAVNIVAMDASGNRSNVQFSLVRNESQMEIPEPVIYQYMLPQNQENMVKAGEFYLSIPKGALYEDLKMRYSATPDESAGVYSEVHHVHESTTPVHKYFEIGITPQNLPPELKASAVIARCNGKKPDNCGGVWKDGMLTTQVRSFGDYCVMVDQIPPTITPVVFDADMRKKSAMAFRISDNFDATDRADDLHWRGTIDGKWVLFEYDSKRARLTYVFDQRVGPGDHTLRLVVTDDRGNQSVFERPFKR